MFSQCEHLHEAYRQFLKYRVLLKEELTKVYQKSEFLLPVLLYLLNVRLLERFLVAYKINNKSNQKKFKKTLFNIIRKSVDAKHA